MSPTVKLEDERVDVLLMVDSEYGEFVTYENGRKFLQPHSCTNTNCNLNPSAKSTYSATTLPATTHVSFAHL
jgi:hypothetical protein